MAHFQCLDCVTLKVLVNTFSHAWTPPRDRENKNKVDYPPADNTQKRVWQYIEKERLNLLPRTNPNPNLHKVKQFLSFQKPTPTFISINTTHFITRQ